MDKPTMVQSAVTCCDYVPGCIYEPQNAESIFICFFNHTIRYMDDIENHII